MSRRLDRIHLLIYPCSGESNIKFQKNGICFYLPHLFHTSPTLSLKRPVPLSINNVINKLVRYEEAYLSMSMYTNLYLLQNHPIQEICVYGRCLGESIRSNFQIIYLDDGSSQKPLPCKISNELMVGGGIQPIATEPIRQDMIHYTNFQNKYLKIQGCLTQYRDCKELHVTRYEILGRETQFDLQIKCWQEVLEFEKTYLSAPWEFVNDDYVDPEDLELKLFYENYRGMDIVKKKGTDDGEGGKNPEVIEISDSEGDQDGDENVDKLESVDLHRQGKYHKIFTSLKFKFLLFCLSSPKKKFQIQQIFDHLKQDITELLIKFHNWSSSFELRKLRFDLFHKIRLELTHCKLIKCTTNLNCKTDNLILFRDKLFQILSRITKSGHRMVKLDLVKYLSSFQLKNNGITVSLELFHMFMRLVIETRLPSKSRDQWELQGNEWMYINNSNDAEKRS